MYSASTVYHKLIYKLLCVHKPNRTFICEWRECKQMRRKKEPTHSTRLYSCCVLSTGLRPVISSKSMTPNEYTSDFSVSLPDEAYSGAKYLQARVVKVWNINVLSIEYRVLTNFTHEIIFIWHRKSKVQHNMKWRDQIIISYSYPRVPIIRVDTCVSASGVSFASPKSATCIMQNCNSQGQKIMFHKTKIDIKIKSKTKQTWSDIFLKMWEVTFAWKLLSKSILATFMSRWMILGWPTSEWRCIRFMYIRKTNSYQNVLIRALTILMQIC